MNMYEDEEEAADTSALGFLKRNKQLVWMAVAFVIAYAFMSHASKQMDEMVARDQVERAADHQRANPWSTDK